MKKHTALVAGFALLVMANAWSQPAMQRNDPKRPVEDVSRDLGITVQQFTTCFQDVQPAPHGTRPTGERVHANKAVLLGCLQKANPQITNEKLDTVMDRYRPGGRDAQRPEGGRAPTPPPLPPPAR